MKQRGEGIVGDQLYLERFVWFDNEARRERFPNASGLGVQFEIAPKTAQRSIDHLSFGDSIFNSCQLFPTQNPINFNPLDTL